MKIRFKVRESFSVGYFTIKIWKISITKIIKILEILNSE
ncbi:hypothetical protein LCGC14_1143520 [marine sediment metagenome]|uniref:Uncharacterized protein n=1 Tax=marine sediment metagenome TaxID=412755 RepID=A0A0F9LXN2_9ZZZZ